MTTEALMTEAATTTEGQASPPAAESTVLTAEPAAEQQVTEGQATVDDGVKSEGEQAKPDGAPEQYEFSAPEGVQLDEQGLAAFSEIAKDLNLTQEAAQKIVDKMAPAMQARQVEVLQKARQEWAEAVKSDQEIGGEKLNENLAVAKKAMDAFGTPGLRALLNESGLGNHPEFVRFVYRAGKAISEDGFVPGGRASAAAQADPAKRLFPNQA
jgi:hypothetical protein